MDKLTDSNHDGLGIVFEHSRGGPVYVLDVVKIVDTIGNCLWTFELNWSSKLRDNYKRKTPLSHEVVCFQMVDFETSNSKSEVSKSNSWENYFFLENYFTSEGAVSHNVLYYRNTN